MESISPRSLHRSGYVSFLCGLLCSLVQVVTLTTITFELVNGQELPRALIITGNGNIPAHKKHYPPWIHEFQNEKVADILKDIVDVEVTDDLTVLRHDRLQEFDLVISNSIFLEPSQEQLDALFKFVSNGKPYFTLHCGILSLLNWNRYEEFIGGIFIGGPSTVPEEFNVVTSNTEFWGYNYSFRNEEPHPISLAVDDFVIKDEIYYFQPSIRDFHVIARAENLPVMWWHPVGRGKVMSLTLGHDRDAKNNRGYQELLRHGVQWLIGAPIIAGSQPRVVSNRDNIYKDFVVLSDIAGHQHTKPVRFNVVTNTRPDLFSVTSSNNGRIQLKLTGKTGQGDFTVQAQGNPRSATKLFNVSVVEDGTGNIAAYHGNTASGSTNENSYLFDAGNVLDDDLSTRWSSMATDSAWVAIDLQKTYTIRKVILEWEASFAISYNIQGSKDGRTWHNVISVTNGDGNTDTLDFPPTAMRYIRINGTKRASDKWGYSLYEVRAYQ